MENEKELSLAEKWENITLANNFIFFKVMHTHPEACKHLLELGDPTFSLSLYILSFIIYNYVL